jgi:tRNA threonylcarbamoyladenosine biosynthesis protein TsaB
VKAVLGLDTATGTVTVAAMRDRELLREVEHGPDQGGRPRTSALLLREVETCVDAAGGWREIGLVAVGIGPGSYTGLRIGLATAKALAQARELPLAGVASLAALGRGIREREGSAGRPVLPVLDARRGEVFAALYGPGGDEIWPPLVASPEQLAERAGSIDPAPVVAGDGSIRFRQELGAVGAEVAPPGDPVHRVAARDICALAKEAESVSPDRIRPIYLRAPDAEKWLERDNRDTDD